MLKLETGKKRIYLQGKKMNGGCNKLIKEIKYFGIHLEMKEDIFQKNYDPLQLLQELDSIGSFDSLSVDISRLPK